MLMKSAGESTLASFFLGLSLVIFFPCLKRLLNILIFFFTIHVFSIHELSTL